MGTPVNIPVKNQLFALESGQMTSEDLGVSPAHFQEFKPGYTITGTFTLKFSVINGFPSYPGWYTAEIYFGTQELGECSGWGTNVATEVTLVCPSPGYLIVDNTLPTPSGGPATGPAQGTSDLVLSFTGNGWPLKFDNVSLIFTPTL